VAGSPVSARLIRALKSSGRGDRGGAFCEPGRVYRIRCRLLTSLADPRDGLGAPSRLNASAARSKYFSASIMLPSFGKDG